MDNFLVHWSLFLSSLHSPLCFFYLQCYSGLDFVW